MRPIPTWLHGILDYVMGIVLIGSPWIFGFADNRIASAVPIILGLSVIGYSLMTAYELGVIGLISMSRHLTLDLIGGILLAASPWLLSFSEFTWWPHVAFGLMEAAAALLTSTQPMRIPTQPVSTGGSSKDLASSLDSKV